VIVLNSFLSLVPVIVLLLSLIYLDSFKLVSFKLVLKSISAGVVAALVCFWLNRYLIDLTNIERLSYSRYIAPVIEESVKAIFIVYLVRSRRVGFLVDSAINGFAIGTGFALVENFYYLVILGEHSPVLFAIRGFGTAVMHSGATAIFAMVLKSLTDRLGVVSIRAYAPGLVLVYLLHSAYNHFPFTPMVTTLVILVLAPLGVIAVFQRSEKVTRNWLGVGLDADAEMLELIISGKISDSKVGRYLESLKSRFAGEAIADMLCYLRIQLELSLQAKGLLLLRQAGIRVEPDADIKAAFAEIEYLENSIGTTGKLALTPFLSQSTRDLWQLHFLGK